MLRICGITFCGLNSVLVEDFVEESTEIPKQVEITNKAKNKEYSDLLAE